MYELRVDSGFGGDTVARFDAAPAQRKIDRVVIRLSRETGWNGCHLELWRDGKHVKDVEPSEKAKEEAGWL